MSECKACCDQQAVEDGLCIECLAAIGREYIPAPPSEEPGLKPKPQAKSGKKK